MWSGFPREPGVAGGKADYVFYFADSLEKNQDHIIPAQAKRDAVDIDQLEAYVQIAPVGRDAIVGFYKNGVEIGAVTIHDGETDGTPTLLDPPIHFEAYDKFTMKILQTGLSVVGSTLSAYGRIAT